MATFQTLFHCKMSVTSYFRVPSSPTSSVISISSDEDEIKLTQEQQDLFHVFLQPTVVVARYILSFDVGVVNLGFSCFDTLNKTFVQVRVFNIKDSIRTTALIANRIAALVAEMVATYPPPSVSKVLIEKQITFRRGPSTFSQAFIRNVSVECALTSAFKVLGMDVVTIQPAKQVTKTGNYQTNKKKAVRLLKDLLKGDNGFYFTRAVLGHIEESVKKDDIADSVLLVVEYLK